MQDYINSNRQYIKTIFAFLLILIVAYLPISTFQFFIKNDAFSGYFPPKFFISESIHACKLPLWNPYINYGIPQYGDMSSGFWSPVTWLIAGTIGYNAYTFTAEVLLYILIGGIGVYKLTGYFNLDNKVRFIAGIAFMCCGYNVGHMQHFNWLSGAAFLPWCACSYLLMQQQFSVKNMLLSVLAFYLFISSAHPGLIIGAFYFFIALAAFVFFSNREIVSSRIKKGIISHTLFSILLIILSAGLIIGYTDILPYFTRGDEVSLAAGLKNPTSFQSWISALFPLSTVKNEALFSTDVSMRNIYFSLTLLLFFIYSIFPKGSIQRFLFYTGIVFMLLSAGGVFKTFTYKFIPFISYVRLDGEFVIFSILCFILLAAIELNTFINEQKEFKGKLKILYYVFEIIVFACIVFGLYKTSSSKQGFLYSFKNITLQNGLGEKLKTLVESITFYDALWLQGIIQLFLLWGIKYCLREKRWPMLTRIVIADLVLATLLNLPFTGVGKASVAEVQMILNKSPKGIPIPVLQPINSNDTITVQEKGLVGDWSFYNKQIGVKKEAPYPIQLKNTKVYFEWIRLTHGITFLNENFLFARNATKPEIVKFTGNNIKFKTSVNNDSDHVIYQQVFYPHWFYSNGKEKKEVLNHFGFMAAPLIKGENEIEFSFEPKKVKIGMLITLISFLVIVLLLLLNPLFIRRSLFPS